MKASELIRVLEDAIEERGDLPVVVEVYTQGRNVPWEVTGLEDTLSFGDPPVAVIEIEAGRELT